MSKKYEKLRNEAMREHFPFIETMKNCRHELTNASFLARQMNCFKKGADWENERTKGLVKALRFYYLAHRGMNDPYNGIFRGPGSFTAECALKEYGVPLYEDEENISNSKIKSPRAKTRRTRKQI